MVLLTKTSQDKVLHALVNRRHLRRTVKEIWGKLRVKRSVQDREREHEREGLLVRPHTHRPALSQVG